MLNYPKLASVEAGGSATHETCMVVEIRAGPPAGHILLLLVSSSEVLIVLAFGIDLPHLACGGDLGCRGEDGMCAHSRRLSSVQGNVEFALASMHFFPSTFQIEQRSPGWWTMICL